MDSESISRNLFLSMDLDLFVESFLRIISEESISKMSSNFSPKLLMCSFFDKCNPLKSEESTEERIVCISSGEHIIEELKPSKNTLQCL